MGSGILALSTRAMLANSSMLETVSHNISNANTEGYSRQTVELASEGGQYTGAGFFGRGVRVQTVSRTSDSFLTREANNNLATSSGDQTRLEKLKQLEKVFPTGEAGLGYAAGQMLNAFVDVANQPQDLSARQVALARAEDLASRMRTAGNQLSELQLGVLSDMKTTVTQINNLASQIADVNQKIAQVKGMGHSPNDLLDQRDELVKQLNTKVQVSTVEADDGSLNVFMGGGQRLVLGTVAETLSVQVDDYDASMGRLAISTTNGTSRLDASVVTGGALAGLMKVQDQDIVSAKNQLGQMAAAMSWRINQQQSFGLDLGSPATSGAAIFSVGAPAVMASRFNTSSQSNPPVSLTIVDGRNLQASDYKMAEDAANPGTYTVTRLSDNTVTSNVTDGTVIDGVRINITGAIGAGDSFVLRPVGNAGANMTRVLDKATGIAAASPVTATVASGNSGTATVGSLSIVATPTQAYDEVNIVFTNATGAYELQDSVGGVMATGTWQAGSPIAFNGWELKLNGVPANGDHMKVAATEYPSGNNGNALTMLSIRDEDIVGRQDLGGGATTPGASITNAYSQLIGDVGVRVQGATTSAQISKQLSDDSQEILKNKTGVNLDEEAARMIQYQQSYQAAAKVLQVAQSVFDTLLSTMS